MTGVNEEEYGPSTGWPALNGCNVGQPALAEPASDDDIVNIGVLASDFEWSIQFVLAHPRPGVTIEPPMPWDMTTFERSVSAIQNWFSAQTGVRLRIKPGIQTVRLAETKVEIAAHGEQIRERIEILLRREGFHHPRTLYAVWYWGTSNNRRCGGGAWPNGVTSGVNRQTPGHVAALYLKTAYTDDSGRFVNCMADQFSTDGQRPDINEFKMLHEIVHTMGLVDPSAPHHHDRGHTQGDQRDLMFSTLPPPAAPLPWLPSIIDPGNDDYSANLRRSVFVDPTPADAQEPPGWWVRVTR